jgi:hypothetical protein
MRRRLRIRKRLKLNRLNARKTFAEQGRRASKTGSYNVCLISAGLTDPFPG